MPGNSGNSLDPWFIWGIPQIPGNLGNSPNSHFFLILFCLMLRAYLYSFHFLFQTFFHVIFSQIIVFVVNSFFTVAHSIFSILLTFLVFYVFSILESMYPASRPNELNLSTDKRRQGYIFHSTSLHSNQF